MGNRARVLKGTGPIVIESRVHEEIQEKFADLMRESSVHYPNTHPDAPKNDWKEGDVQGVLEIIHPVDLGGASGREEND